jgi:hypothetical protein
MSLLVGVAGLVLANAASAQLIEGFEHGNAGLYLTGGGINPNLTLNAASARTGNFGSQYGNVGSPLWYYRTDLTTAPGNEYYCYVRFTNSAGAPLGRVYIGVAASATGCWSMVAGPNTSQIILQNNNNWGFVNAAVAPASFAPDTWYQMRLNWEANGNMTLSLYDESGTTLLAQTPTVSTGVTTPGGIALRGFTTASTAFNHVDDIGRVAASACPGTGAGACSRADWNEDGVIDFNDFLAFLNDFNAEDPCADLNQDGVVDFNDFLEFLNIYNVGC